MSKTKISEFSTTPGNNTDINGINIAEGCAPSGINNAIRELMSDLKEWQSGAMDVYVIPQGTAAAPGIQLYGDLDTGLYGFAANQLGVAVGGASAGYFSSDGWVGNVVATTVDLTNIEVTNIKAKDGTTSISLADSTGIATFSKATVIETTDNTNAALRITQLGTGNALLVEDATNPDTTPTVIDQFGNVILGTTARTTPVTSKVEIHSTSSENLGLTPSLGFYNWSATASSASHLTFRHYPSGTVGTLAANTSGDVLGRVVFLSYDGTNAFSASIIGVSGAGGASPSISYTAAGGHNFSSGVVSVSTQLNADNLRLDGNTISSTDTDGNIVISPNGTGDVQIDADTVRVGDSNANVTITTNGTGDLTLNTNSGTSSGYIQILDGANGNIGIVPDGTGIVYLSSSTVVTGNANPSTKITTLGTSDLTLDTNEGFESGSIFIENGVNGDIIITPDGTGKTQISGTLDVTTIEATNIRAKDGTASIVLTDVSGAVDISKAVTFSTTTETIALGTSQTTGTFTVGGAAQTGTQTFDQSTKTHTLNLGTGATESGLTKTINLGTGGVSTSTTAINIGSANGTTTTLNGTVTAATLNSTTIDTTNLEVTNIKAKDGTAALSIADSTGAVTVATALTANGGAVFNENGADVDFRVEGDTDVNLIFADASTDRVGIGTNAPTNLLSVAGNANITGNVTLGDATTDTVLVNGYMGVGGAPNSQVSIGALGSSLTGANQYAFQATIQGNSAATTSINGFYSAVATTAESFTCANLRGVWIASGAIGAGSAVTNKHGLFVSDQTGGTNNFGITSQVSSGTDKWNIYASGTAQNYFAGNVGIGTNAPNTNVEISTTVDPILRLNNSTNTVTTGADIGEIQFYTNDASVNGTGVKAFVKTVAQAFGSAQGGADLVFGTAAYAVGDASEKMRIDKDGNVGIGTNSPGSELEVLSTDSATAIRVSSGAASTTTGTSTLRLQSFNSGSGVVGSAEIFNTAPAGGQSILAFSTSPSGNAPTERLRIDSTGALIAKPAAGTGAVFNEDGVDADFRVESDTNTHALFVQGSDGNVGIGTSSPAVKLDVSSATGSASPTPTEIRIATTSNASDWSTTLPWGRLSFYNADSSGTGPKIHASIDTTSAAASGALSVLSFSTNISSTNDLIERLRFQSNEAVFNDPGNDYDFRVESDTNTHALFVEGTNSNVKIGGSAERATTVGTNHLDIFNGTAPVGTLTNGISLYSSSGEAYVMDAAGNATLFSPHDKETNEWIFKSKHTPTGKVLKIDVEKLLRFVNNHFGLDAIQEFIEE